ncbi:MAG: methyltransferase [Firmicutes bacterium HGW-Firmicutes-7]|nr:MAG: methyltransferase [Firmicutes bacterium HGW-Firmicutes-7]
MNLFELPDLVIIGNHIDFGNYTQNTFTILLAAIIGSVIGWERENRNRPAGLRTYSLVCVGSAIVMITSFEVFELYNNYTNFDPTRLGAQVISGIGFLGAGTIIRDQFSVKGLTTAASLWVVGCIGLTVGSRMYVLSIIVSIVVYYVLHNLRSLDELKGEKINYEIILTMKKLSGEINHIQKLVDKYITKAVHVVSIQESNGANEVETTIVINVTIIDDHDEYNVGAMIMELYKIKDIISVICKEI